MSAPGSVSMCSTRWGPDGRRGDPVERVQDVPDGGVADGVGGGRDARRGQLPHGAGVRGRVRPEAVGGLAQRVGLFEPRGAVVDGAVDHELDAADRPSASAAALQIGERGQPVGVDARHAPRGESTNTAG